MFSNGDKVAVKSFFGEEEFGSGGLNLRGDFYREEISNRRHDDIGMIIGPVPRYESYYKVRSGTKIAIYHCGELKRLTK